MTRGNWLVCVASLLLMFTLALRASERVATQYAAAAGQPATDSGSEYLGSESCAKCHDAEHKQWKDSLHIQMTRPVADAKVLGDFREGDIVQKDITVEAKVKLPDGQTVQKNLVVTASRTVMKNEKGETLTGRWIITSVKEAQAPKTS